jgi:hypothetical protein
MTDRAVAKAARMAALLEADDRGLLAGRSLQEIADALGHGNHRSTILRDLRQLPEVRRLRSRYRAALENLRTD